MSVLNRVRVLGCQWQNFRGRGRNSTIYKGLCALSIHLVKKFHNLPGARAPLRPSRPAECRQRKEHLRQLLRRMRGLLRGEQRVGGVGCEQRVGGERVGGEQRQQQQMNGKGHNRERRIHSFIETQTQWLNKYTNLSNVIKSCQNIILKNNTVYSMCRNKIILYSMR